MILSYQHHKIHLFTIPHLQVNIGFPAHFRHLFIQFQFSIQFRPKKLTAFKSKVKFRQIVIHISELRMQGSNSPKI